MPPAIDHLRLPTAAVRWRCPPDWLPFKTTAEVKPVSGVVGQDDAVAALQFGLEIDAPGQNVYVRGLTGTGRVSLVEQLLRDAERPCAPAADRCYVHNFETPDQPALLTLPRGQARAFQARVDALIEFISQQLAPALNADTVRARRTALSDKVQAELRDLGKPFEEELKRNNLALVPVQMGDVVQPAILPLVDGKPVPLKQLEELAAQGQANPADVEATHRRIAEFAAKLEDVGHKTQEIQARHREALRDLYQGEARRIVGYHITQIEHQFPQPAVAAFLTTLCDDLVEKHLLTLAEDTAFTRRYRVNPVLSHADHAPCPVVVETAPTMQNLLGNIDRELVPGGAFRSDHLMVHAGSLLRADGGYLVLQVRDVLAEPGAWKILLRTLRTGLLEVVPPELTYLSAGPMLKPQAIPINVKVILIGDPGLYVALDRIDPDFSHLFKVLADFDTTIPRDNAGVAYYAGILARIAGNENLLPLDAGAVAAVAEQGARVAAQGVRLTTRFGRLSDIVREAAHIAAKDNATTVTADHVIDAIRRGRRRADLPARRFRGLIADGTIRIQTSGATIGQINGLAVIGSGPLTYGFPSRITATIGPGTAGTVNIEREAELSGAIHTKGFYILGGLLRHLLRTEHPLAFSASIAFEQSYGGIDGDSASGAEMCCLLSALTGIPLRQDLAMTGAIDQHGHIQPVGATTEKIEGFFAACNDADLTGTQGAVVPRANAADLMLNHDVVAACDAGKFHVYAVDTIHEALAILTGYDVGEPDGDGNYPAGTLLQIAEARAYDYWRMATQKPDAAQ